jgi:hypothetical protein
MREILRSILIVSAVLLCNATLAHAQFCPDEKTGAASSISELRGTVRYHDDLRKWLSLDLERSACGLKQSQLVFSNHELARRAKSLDGCKATATGMLYFGETGYYSSTLAISVESLEPDKSCQPAPMEPDPALTRIPLDLRSYYASITVDYRGNGHLTVDVWRDATSVVRLEPWQAYVSYSLNGGADVLYFGCREGFLWRNAAQVPKSTRSEIQGAPEQGVVDLSDSVSPNVITFACEKTKQTQSGGNILDNPKDAREAPEHQEATAGSE